ncbi:MAG: Lrp/AsnC family transcriptional regulator [Armatimonadota bacterium]|nr:Lrp/AsnC family transcriptional regulator [Armatimonadota bacterium]
MKKINIRFPGAVPLDALDLALIGQLQSDGRASLTDLARALRVSVGTVRNRLHRLVRSGVVRIAAIVDPARVGFPTRVIIVLNAALAHQEAVERALAGLPEVTFVASVAGRFDFMIEAAFASDAHLREFLVHRLSRIKGIQDTETLHVLSMGKRMWHWVIPQAQVSAPRGRGAGSRGRVRNGREEHEV